MQMLKKDIQKSASRDRNRRAWLLIIGVTAVSSVIFLSVVIRKMRSTQKVNYITGRREHLQPMVSRKQKSAAGSRWRGREKFRPCKRLPAHALSPLQAGVAFSYGEQFAAVRVNARLPLGLAQRRPRFFPRTAPETPAAGKTSPTPAPPPRWPRAAAERSIPASPRPVARRAAWF